MAKVPKIMELFQHLAQHKILEKDGKILITLTLSDKSTADIYINLDVNSKLQSELRAKLTELVKEN